MKLGFLMLSVRDLATAVSFYKDTLDLPVRMSSAEMAFLDAEGVMLVLRHDPKHTPLASDSRVEIVFSVPDIAEAYERLRGRGVAFRVEPRVVTGEQHAADFRDPDGHLLSIFGPRRAG